MKYFGDEKKNDLALRLRAFAEEQAKARSLYFWNILRNKAIISICKELPRTVDDLGSKKVLVGKKTIEKYGEEIVCIVNAWIAENADAIGQKARVSCEQPKGCFEDKAMLFRQGGFYYNASGNDALILHKYLGYKLYGVNTPRTGFPVAGMAKVLEKIDKLSIDYDVVDKTGKVVACGRFENNRYEVIGLADVAAEEEPDVPIDMHKKSFKERLAAYITILEGLSEGVDVISGEVVEGLSEDVRVQLFEMSVYFDDRLKSREARDNRCPSHGSKWTPEEDEQLLEEYMNGAKIKELAELHGRSTGAIRSRLLNLNVINKS